MGVVPDAQAWLNPATLTQATAIQRAIAARVEMVDRFPAAPSLAGADTSMRWRDSRGPIHAAIAPLAGAAATATIVPPFPYVPGYLGFREAPALLAAWARLAEKPDLLIVDGQGRAHPRRCGIASHIGVLLDWPTIGVAKSLLCGQVEGVLGEAAGATAPLVDRGELIGLALRSRARAKPIFVSIGHRVSLESALALIRSVGEGRRQPLPIRRAHDAANAARRAWEAAGATSA
ncbi:endonuclease V [Sphingomonas morindae]|uniref:Endonuclease V n=1 Tax=Sphingomonas morindae TaxID=1541170 RepID=A0ABY4X7Z6_9SPHN|nr:endonuclease V [Sphingomonas morindae]USI73063.1 endonuclease V [Sphingomonas morindae]